MTDGVCSLQVLGHRGRRVCSHSAECWNSKQGCHCACANQKGVSQPGSVMGKPTHQSMVSIVSRKVHRGAYSPCDVICSNHAAPEHKLGEGQVADTTCLSHVGHAASAVICSAGTLLQTWPQLHCRLRVEESGCGCSSH